MNATAGPEAKRIVSNRTLHVNVGSNSMWNLVNIAGAVNRHVVAQIDGSCMKELRIVAVPVIDPFVDSRVLSFLINRVNFTSAFYVYVYSRIMSCKFEVEFCFGKG